MIDLTKVEPFSLTNSEYFAISRDLESYHTLFYKFWELGKPSFTDAVATAAVCFDKKGQCIHFLFNPLYWKQCNSYTRSFIIAHECLHVILNHGIRIKDSDDKERCNRALDVVVNHSLVNSFGFNRKHIMNQEELCWVDTVLPEEHFADDESFEFYYNRMEEQSQQPVLVDCHDFFNEEETEEVVGKLNGELSPEEKESLKEFISDNFQSSGEEGDETDSGRGTHEGSLWVFNDPKKHVAKKKKWETIIKQWAHKRIKQEFDAFEQWVRVNRRISDLPRDIALPSEMESDEKEDRGKCIVYLFMDSSGSCYTFAERFYKAARSLPSKRFDMHLFCFDTRVHDVDIKIGHMFGYGGTCFDVLEYRIQDDLKKKKIKKYPDGVFVLTDGYGNEVKPAFPGKWHFFLTYPSAGDAWVPKGAKKYNLAKFE